jgi:hypothetical protein
MAWVLCSTRAADEHDREANPLKGVCPRQPAMGNASRSASPTLLRHGTQHGGSCGSQGRRPDRRAAVAAPWTGDHLR